MTIRTLVILTGLLFLLVPTEAQRVVVLCLSPADKESRMPHLLQQAADLQGAQALVLSRVASSPWRRSEPLSLERWERSAYLTLNAGTRALAPENLPAEGIERLRCLLEANAGWNYPVVIGLLPEELKAKGVRIRYLTLRPDSPMLLVGAPFALRDTRAVSDFPMLLRIAEFMVRGHSRLMLWVDADGISPVQRQTLVGALYKNLTQPQDKLYLLLPIPTPAEAQKGLRLGWVMRLGREDSGVLASRSTRLPGYITLPDLTATWLSHFGSASIPPEVLGSPARTLPDEEAVQRVHRLYLSSLRQVWWNRTVGALPTAQTVVLVVAWLCWYRFGRVMRALWLFPCLVPVLGVSLAPVLICLPLGGISPQARAGIWIAVLAGLLVWLSRFPLRYSLRGLATVLLVFVGVGLLHGGDLLRWSGFGYILQEGARFYGVGNEMAGSLLGAQSGFLLTEGAGWGLVRWLATALAVGAPFWGANVGAMLASLCVAGVQALRSRRVMLWGMLAVAVLAVGVVAWEIASPNPTHLGAFLRNPQNWLPTLARKAQMNLALLWQSAWTPLLVFGLLGLKGAPAGVWAGAIGLLVLNDSGVVAAAAMLAWWWAWRVAGHEQTSP
ncbi:MAG: hypothetical protein HPY54_14875 [Chthonomonadetes bacterium]|nr:hypothetical protein [Chthonomonadetes bacterium]